MNSMNINCTKDGVVTVMLDKKTRLIWVILLIAVAFIPVGPVCLLISIVGLYVCPAKWRWFLPLLVYAFFVGAYTYEPPANEINNDLLRYLPEIEKYGNLTFAQAMRRNDDFLIARDLMFWCFGKMGLPHMVPAITSATVYYVAGYISCDSAERNHAQRWIGLIVTFQIFMIPYISVINNVRNVFSFSLVILAAYYDIVKKKRNIFVLLLYTFGALMHLSTFVLVLFRVVAIFAKRYFVIIIPFPLVFSAIIMFLYSHFRVLYAIPGSIGLSIRIIVVKLYGYLTDTSSSYAVKAMNSITFKIDKLLIMTAMVLFLYLIFAKISVKNKIKLKTNKKKEFYTFIRMLTSLFIRDKEIIFIVFAGLIAIMTLSCSVFALPNYWRCSAGFITASGVLLVICLKRSCSQPFHINCVLVGLLCIAPMELLIQLWKYRLYDFMGWITDFCSFNIISIISDYLK